MGNVKALKLIDGNDLYYAFLSGAEEIIYNKDELNKINVFPVADGDTGSNLSSTMFSIMYGSKSSKKVSETLKSISETSLVGARGNSGIIFAQFFNGLYESLKEKERITIHDFQKAANISVEYAYSAVITPVEGTILTVIREWAISLRNHAKMSKDFYDLFKKSLKSAQIALEKTKTELEVLKKANVVDSGGEGFVNFIEGINKFFKEGKEKVIEKIHKNLNQTIEEEHIINSDITYRYCTEGLIEGKQLNKNKIKSQIEKLGDSFIIAGNKEKIRIHIHTNFPADVFSILTKHGNIINQKVDDMKMQYELTHNRKYEIALVTDSIADLPQQYIECEQINVVPLSIFIDNNEYYDKLTINSSEFYDLADSTENFPTSSQPSTKVFEKLFSFLSSYYNHIIGVFVASELSGTYKNALKAAEKLKKKDYDIAIFDSKQNSGAQGLLVTQIQEKIKTGEEYEDIVKAIPELIEKAKIYVSVDDFSYMVKGGRVSALKGKIAKILNLKVIVSLDSNGKGIIYDKAFSKKGSIRKILKELEKERMKNSKLKYCIVHSNAKDRAENLKKRIMQKYNKEPEYIVEVSSIVGISAGRGSVALCII